MSEKNREGKRSARERLAQERAREQAAQKRMRLIRALGIAVLALGLAGLVGYLATNNGDGGGDGAAAEPIAQGETGAPVTLSIYEDFRCPACAQFEKMYRDVIHDLQDEGTLRTEYHLVTIIDNGFGGEGSHAAANAAVCAEDAGLFRDYHDLLYDEQPPESQDRFADTDYLIELAGDVEGLDTETFRDCVRNDTHGDYVRRSQADFRDSGYGATPTVLLDGEDIYGDASDPLTPQRLRERVEEAAAGAS